MHRLMEVTMVMLREALEASWDEKTAFQGVHEKGNPALGSCYPSAWVVQQFFPRAEIVEGQVWTGGGMEKHFWNVLQVGDAECHIDFTWSQFPHGSSVKSYKIRDRETLGDGPQTKARCQLLFDRVNAFLADIYGIVGA